jgi:hypothetical protein
MYAATVQQSDHDAGAEMQFSLQSTSVISSLKSWLWTRVCTQQLCSSLTMMQVPRCNFRCNLPVLYLH